MKSNKFLLAAAMLLAGFSGRAQSADTISYQLSIDSVSVHALMPLRMHRSSSSTYVVDEKSADNFFRSASASMAELLPRLFALESSNLQGLNNDIESSGFTSSAFGYQRYTRLLVDGMPAGTRYAATNFPTNLERITLYYHGSSPSLSSGGAIGGVIDLTTRQSRGKLSGSATLHYGSWNTFDANAAMGGSLAAKFDFDLGFDYQRRVDDYRTGSHNLLKTTAYEKRVYDLHAYDTLYSNTSFDKQRATLRIGWDIAPEWRLNLYNELYHTGNAPSNGTLWGLYDQIDHRLSRHFHRLDLTGRAGRHAIRVSPYIGREESRFADFGPYGNYRRTGQYNTYGMKAHDVVRFDRGTLAFGVEHLAERNNSTRALEDGTPQAPNYPDYLSAQTGAFAQFELELFDDDLTAEAAVRYDNTRLRTFRTELLDAQAGVKDFGALSPSLSLHYRFAPTMSLWAHVGSAFLAPEAYKMTGNYTDAWGTSYRGNPDLKPERATTWQLGWGFRPHNGVAEVSAYLFSTDHRNLAITDPDQLEKVYINAQRASIRGFDINGWFDLGRALSKGWTWKFRVDYQRIFHSEITTPSFTSERLYLSRTKAALQSEFIWKSFSASISGRYASSKKEENWLCAYDYTTGQRIPYVTSAGMVVRPALASEPYIRTPDFITFDASISWRPTQKLALQATAANLFDELYMERDGYYMPGRNFRLGISFDF